MSVRSTFSSHGRLVAGFSALALATAGLTVLTTNALFTSSAVVTTGTFTTGTITLGATPATAALSFATMAPGDQVWAPITVSNTGSIPLRYAMTSVPNAGTLGAALQLTIRTVANTGLCIAGATGWDIGVPVVGPINFSTTPVIFGSTTTGNQAGDRTLGANTGSEVLCANVILPIGTTSQILTPSSATFTFTAEQTTNNP